MDHEFRGTFMDHEAFIDINEARPESLLSTPELKKLTTGDHRAFIGSKAKLESAIALVESRTFMRECLHRGLQEALGLPVLTFSALSDLEREFTDSISLFFLSLTDASPAECANALKVLTALDPHVPVVVLSTVNDSDLARTAINFGAKGYIPSTTNFEIAIEAVRFILAGGTYVPMECLFAASTPTVPSVTQPSSLSEVLTDREISVVQAIQEGQSNKVIAYKLCICEGTVKVHLRNIMKKLKAKNRTEVAIKAQAAFALEAGRSQIRFDRAVR